MSRTIRRKNVKWGYCYKSYRDMEKDYQHHEVIYGYKADVERKADQKWVRCSPSKDLGQVKLKKYFYTDKYSPMNNPSWWVRETVHVPVRRMNRDELRNVIKTVDRDDLEETIVTEDLRVPYYW